MAMEKDRNARFDLAQKRTRGFRTILAVLVLLFMSGLLLDGGSEPKDDKSARKPGPFYVPGLLGLAALAIWLIVSDWTTSDPKVPPEEDAN